MVATRAVDAEMKNLESRIVNEFSLRAQQVNQIDIVNKQLADEALSSYEDLKAKMFTLEKKYSHLQRHLERSGPVSINSYDQKTNMID